MKRLEYNKENLRLLAYIVSNATSGTQFTKLLKDGGWTPGTTASQEWQLSKKNKEEFLYDEFIKVADIGRFDIFDYIVDKTLLRDEIYFKKGDKDYKFPRQAFTRFKERLEVVKESKQSTNLKLFNSRKLHKSIIYSSKKLFSDGYFSFAIFEGCKAIDKRVQNMTGLGSTGFSLMEQAFKKQSPIIQLNDLLNRSDNDEQDGFLLIFKGVMLGIRNPKGHEFIDLRDPYRALEYLGLLSLLMKRLDEAKVNI